MNKIFIVIAIILLFSQIKETLSVEMNEFEQYNQIINNFKFLQTKSKSLGIPDEANMSLEEIITKNG